MISSQEIQQNLYSLYDDVAASGLVSSGTAGGYSFIRHTASAWPNMVYPGPPVAGRHPDIAALVESVKAGRCPRLVLFEEGGLTADLVAEMNSFRFVPAAQWINMAVSITGPEEGAGWNDDGEGKQLDCKVVDVRNPVEWKDWESVVEEVLFKKEKLAVDLFSYGCEKGLFKLLIGYYGDRAVSTTLLYMGRLAGVYMVATLPPFRGKGFGRVLMRFTGSAAAADGYSSLVLHSTKGGLGLYERLGYQSEGKLLLYYCMA